MLKEEQDECYVQIAVHSYINKHSTIKKKPATKYNPKEFQFAKKQLRSQNSMRQPSSYGLDGKPEDQITKALDRQNNSDDEDIEIE